jgi:hypothetical protein
MACEAVQPWENPIISPSTAIFPNETGKPPKNESGSNRNPGRAFEAEDESIMNRTGINLPNKFRSGEPEMDTSGSRKVSSGPILRRLHRSRLVALAKGINRRPRCRLRRPLTFSLSRHSSPLSRDSATPARTTEPRLLHLLPIPAYPGKAKAAGQGWREDGKWQRKRFKDRKKAETFAAALRVQLENKGRAQRMVLSPLSDSQHEEALQAFDRLGGTYTLTEAVGFFLRHTGPRNSRSGWRMRSNSTSMTRSGTG